jgi:hypothetical protein
MDVDDTSLVPVYVGQCRFLRSLPACAVALGLLALTSGGGVGVAVVFALPAILGSMLLPWRFAVLASGIALWFGFGKRRVLAREDVTVRVDLSGAVVMRRGARRVGYPLSDGLVQRNSAALRDTFVLYGFDLAD